MLPSSCVSFRSTDFFSPTPSLSPPLPTFSLAFSVSLNPYPLHRRRLRSLRRVHGYYSLSGIPKPESLKLRCSASGPLKVMISGAPASGKGTQCEMIVQKYGLVHISTGDLLRAEVSSGTEIGNKAKEYMNMGLLVPDEIVTAMVTMRLSQQDAKEKGWLLDGYPRSSAQAQSLEKLKIKPDIYVVLDVPDEILIDRCVGRRLDPVTGKIYHLNNFPPENDEIKGRLITRPDDTEEKVKSRLEVYKKNTEAISSTYSDVLNKIDGNRPKEAVFREISHLLSKAQEDEVKATKLGKQARESGSSATLVSAGQPFAGKMERNSY